MTGDGHSPITVVLVEDHAAVSMGVKAILERTGHEVTGMTDDPNAAHRLVLGSRPDVALLDVNLGGRDGVAIARGLLSARPDQGVLLYTGYEETRRLNDALAFGVRGVALKAGPPEELVEAVQTVAGDGVYLDPRLRESLGRSSAGAGGSVLSPREREVFQLLAEGLRGEEIAERLVLSSETVRTHVRNAMQRLGARTRAHAVALALARGEIDA